jgi:hypothetical protein
MGIKKEYEKFFDRKKDDLCVHSTDDVIEFVKHYNSLKRGFKRGDEVYAKDTEESLPQKAIYVKKLNVLKKGVLIFRHIVIKEGTTNQQNVLLCKLVKNPNQEYR